jgi:hypothetical protein
LNKKKKHLIRATPESEGGEGGREGGRQGGREGGRELDREALSEAGREGLIYVIF